ncbi:uncharacterized protein LOC121246355 [Juglans microcarpa x Juglans regia]|uniref:uncharacterized protein LOC121246355 n=1 Tax=Juglans microcarpa x Juglans regia TaxID=2249226 RepID=UPI001B7F00C1|nr:uncharacterized protein LOC121246355 [Juglans microcarpa x Juglans regia]
MRLIEWSRVVFGNSKRKLNSKLKQLSALQSFNTGNLGKDIKRIQEEIDQLLEEEDVTWKQRAKQKWLKDGDRNSKFFHHCSNQRRKTNTIKCIKDEEGTEAVTHKAIANQFRVFFKGLFTTSCLEGMAEYLGSVEARISSDMSSFLSKKFTEKEVE